MASLPVYDRNGAEVGQYEIDPQDLAPRISKQLLHDVVVMYQANQRQGTHKTKTRGEIAGTTRKMYRQKGTGNARAGSRRSGIRRGGGHMKVVRPRDYRIRMPRKALRSATRMAIASKIRDNQLVLIDELSFDVPKTKDMVSVLEALGLSGVSLLIATVACDVNVHRSARNISRVEVAPVTDLNAWCVLRPSRMLITRAAMDSLCGRSVAAADVQPGEEAAGDPAPPEGSAVEAGA
jgi:large subunit ribosomal protein L4